MAEHSEAIERAFTQQAEAFEDPSYNRLFTTDSEWLFDRLPLTADDLVLDVAAGTGHVARRMAPKVRAVLAIDATEAMLEAGRDRGQARRAAKRRLHAGRRGRSCRSWTPRSTSSSRASPSTTSRTRGCSSPRCAAACGWAAGWRSPTWSATPIRRSPSSRTTSSGCATPRTRGCSRSRSWPSWWAAPTSSSATSSARSARGWSRPRRRRRRAPRSARRSRPSSAGGPPTGFRPREIDGQLRFLHTMASVIA